MKRLILLFFILILLTRAELKTYADSDKCFEEYGNLYFTAEVLKEEYISNGSIYYIDATKDGNILVALIHIRDTNNSRNSISYINIYEKGFFKTGLCIKSSRPVDGLIGVRIKNSSELYIYLSYTARMTANIFGEIYEYKIGVFDDELKTDYLITTEKGEYKLSGNKIKLIKAEEETQILTIEHEKSNDWTFKVFILIMSILMLTNSNHIVSKIYGLPSKKGQGSIFHLMKRNDEFSNFLPWKTNNSSCHDKDNDNAKKLNK